MNIFRPRLGSVILVNVLRFETKLFNPSHDPEFLHVFYLV